MRRYVISCTIILALLVPLLGSSTHSYAQGNRELTFWTFIDPSGTGVRQKAERNVVQTFEAANPGVKVVPQIIQWDQMSPSLLRAVQARRVPDVSLIYSPYLPLQMAAGSLEPLNKYTGGWTQAQRTDWVVPLQNTSYQGNLYGLFYEVRVAGFLYRQDILAKDGLIRPRSLPELLSVAEALKNTGLVGLPMAFSPQDSFGITIEWFLPLVTSMGGSILNPDGSAGFNNPAAERVVQWVADLAKTGVLPKDVAYMGEEQTEQIFVSGRAAILHTDTTRLDAIRQNSGAGRAVQFGPPLGFDTRPIPATVLGWVVVIPRGAQNPDLAWKFIQHWTSPAMQLADSKAAGYLPTRKSVINDPWYQADAASDIRFAVGYASAHPFNFQWPQAIDALYVTLANMFEQVIDGKMTPAEGLTWASNEYNAKRTQ